MSKYLFLFTIGPVKSFIQESRKAQDLFASSALLSHLCKSAIITASKKLKDYEFELITPFIGLDKLVKDKFPSIPNRFLVSVTGEATDLKQIAQAIEDKIKADFSKITLNSKELGLSTSAKKQLEKHLDIRWVLSEYENYDIAAYQNVNKQLAAIKNYNSISLDSEIGRKCIVDGKNNIKFYRKNKNETIQINPKTDLYNKLYQKKGEVKIIEADDEDFLKVWHLQKGEGISAVTLKKRLYENKAHEFDSTASISLMHVFKELENNDSFEKFKNQVNGKNKIFGHSNDQLFYKDNIRQLFNKEYGIGAKTDRKIKEFETKHESWSKDLSLPLTTYYALIRFDGDHLGNWFSGENKGNDILLKFYHQKLSACITAFADTMKTELKKPMGKVIYSGGEDFMAMVNLHHLKDAITYIRKQFKEMVSEPMQMFIKDKKEFTLSMGITIAHYKEPLQLVLDKTATMEKLAKNTGRNKFALRISKHSGSQLQATLPWEIDNVNSIASIYDLVELIKDKKISPAFLLNSYNYCDELDFNEEANPLIQSKMKLFIRRATIEDKDVVFKQVHTIVSNFIEHSKNVKDFANMLLITDFIQRHEYSK